MYITKLPFSCSHGYHSLLSCYTWFHTGTPYNTVLPSLSVHIDNASLPSDDTECRENKVLQTYSSIAGAFWQLKTFLALRVFQNDFSGNLVHITTSKRSHCFQIFGVLKNIKAFQENPKKNLLWINFNMCMLQKIIVSKEMKLILLSKYKSNSLSEYIHYHTVQYDISVHRYEVHSSIVYHRYLHKLGYPQYMAGHTLQKKQIHLFYQLTVY